MPCNLFAKLLNRIAKSKFRFHFRTNSNLKWYIFQMTTNLLFNYVLIPFLGNSYKFSLIQIHIVNGSTTLNPSIVNFTFINESRLKKDESFFIQRTIVEVPRIDFAVRMNDTQSAWSQLLVCVTIILKFAIYFCHSYSRKFKPLCRILNYFSVHLYEFLITNKRRQLKDFGFLNSENLLKFSFFGKRHFCP